MDKFLSKENINYNDEQLSFIKEPLSNCKLLGIPGGGKTQSIIGKILYNYSNNIITKNNNFLILTFSRRACNDFIDKGRKQNKILFNNKNIRTIHSIAGKIVYNIMEKTASSHDTVIISSIDLLQNHKEEIKQMEEFNSLKVIFVDEAQDISYVQYQFVLKIGELTNSHVILIGDPNQNIYQFQNGSDEYLLKHPGNTHILVKNYRSTPHLVNFINNFRPWDNNTSKMVSTKEDNDPYNKKPIIFIGSVEEILNDIAQKILKSPFPREEIAIIGPVKKSNANIGLSLFTEFLKNYNIDYIKHYDNEENQEEEKKKNHINLFTIHGSKGLEFHQVFLINFHTKTFGMIPTEEKYKEFKYLWYVGLSRASYDLNIYVEKTKLPWNELKKCPQDLYLTENTKPVFAKELKFQDEILPIYNTLDEILNSKLLFDLENVFDYKVETVKLYDVLENQNEYSPLYKMFIENIFNYYYNKKCVPDYVIKLKKIINNTIILPKKYMYGYKILKIRCPFIKDLMTLSKFISIKNQLKHEEEKIYEYLCDYLKNNYEMEFLMECENDVTNYPKNDLLESINYLENMNNDNTQEIIKHIFKITIYYYQNSNEASYLWNINFREELKDLEVYVNSIIDYSKNINEKFDFHKVFKHSKLPLIGKLDMYNSEKIVNIKFTDDLNKKDILEIILYNHIINPCFDKDYQLEIWNFLSGNKYIIKLNKREINIYKLLKILSTSLNKKIENMIFIYDLITTGSSYSNKKIDIIERHFQEFTTSIIVSSGLLKPVYVPFIPFQVTSATGIKKEEVFESGDDINKFRNEMKDIFNDCINPIFITYDINKYENKLLFNNNSYKLLDSKIIIRLFSKDYVDKNLKSNRTKMNVEMIISIFNKLGITEEKILNIY